MKRIIIIGGGISGLVTSIQLARRGMSPILIEKKTFPFHRVCGEYISNEATPFLREMDLYPESFSPPLISRFELSSVNGKSAKLPLELGGFGISRFVFDHFLLQKALLAGVQVLQGTQVESVRISGGTFLVNAGSKVLEADIVIGSFGKRSVIDASMGRNFIRKRSPYLGIKYHIRSDHPADLISLHNFEGGYCGISRIEDGKYNLCYLSRTENLKRHGSIDAMEEAVLFRNPILKSIFTKSEFLFDKPETINEISFETKGPVDQHVLMTGDAAGMITPLCGNGMAMALHSSKLLAELVSRFCEDASYSRDRLEYEYSTAWKQAFGRRLQTGRYIQKLFGGNWASGIGVGIGRNIKPLARWLVSKTHGKIF